MTAPTAPKGHVFFPGDDRLEGVLEWPEGMSDPAATGATDPGASGRTPAASESAPIDAVRGGVVIAHPYPPDGANMAQPVVYRIGKSCRARGLATLRFNFRGVGESRGAFSGTQEYRDVEAAAAFLRGRLANLEGDAAPGPSTPPLTLAGYSFGSMMSARAAAGLGWVKALALVGFVVRWEKAPPDILDRLRAFRGPVLAVCAENDDLGYPEEVERVLKDLGLDFTMSVVKGVGHFLEGKHREVGELVATWLAETISLGRAVI